MQFIDPCDDLVSPVFRRKLKGRDTLVVFGVKISPVGQEDLGNLKTGNRILKLITQCIRFIDMPRHDLRAPRKMERGLASLGFSIHPFRILLKESFGSAYVPTLACTVERIAPHFPPGFVCNPLYVLLRYIMKIS